MRLSTNAAFDKSESVRLGRNGRRPAKTSRGGEVEKILRRPAEENDDCDSKRALTPLERGQTDATVTESETAREEVSILGRTGEERASLLFLTFAPSLLPYLDSTFHSHLSTAPAFPYTLSTPPRHADTSPLHPASRLQGARRSSSSPRSLASLGRAAQGKQ